MVTIKKSEPFTSKWYLRDNEIDLIKIYDLNYESSLKYPGK